jgi:dihydrodipicolinate synthase/N-acetylneuraminate lyase
MLIPVRSGSIVAIVTPMTESNAIDYVKLDSLLKWHIQEGIMTFDSLIPLLLTSLITVALFLYFYCRY